MKKRSRRGDPQRQRHWEELMRRWREDGQTARAFCRAEGVRESAFYFWRRELARRGRQSPGGDVQAQASPALPVGRRRSSRPGAVPVFLPVEVVEPSRAEAVRGVEIVLEQGRRVRVLPGFDRQTLADVLSVLEVRPC